MIPISLADNYTMTINYQNLSAPITQQQSKLYRTNKYLLQHWSLQKKQLFFVEWEGDKIVDELTLFIKKNNPELKGFEVESFTGWCNFMKSMLICKLCPHCGHNYKNLKTNQIKLKYHN